MPSPIDTVPGFVLDAVRKALSEGRLLAFTGAGVSAESGIPTFRGPGGMWRNKRPEDLATPEAFRRDPEGVWEWYHWRRARIARCRPNEAHLTLASWAWAGGVRIVTQNVDGLHDLALELRRPGSLGQGGAGSSLAPGPGSGPPRRGPPEPPVRLHGSLFHTRCTACGNVTPYPFEDDPSEEGPPTCRQCEGLLRPAVVWFGEALAPEDTDRAFRWATEATVTLSIGTSAVVFPAAQVPLTTLAGGGIVIEINPEETPLSAQCTLHVRAPAVQAVPALLGSPGHP